MRIVAKAKIFDLFSGVTSTLFLEEQRAPDKPPYFIWYNDTAGEITATGGSTYDLAVFAAMQEWWAGGFKLTVGRAPVKPEHASGQPETATAATATQPELTAATTVLPSLVHH
jgi:hypothetical protein